MQAETLNCPMCGAAASSDATKCIYCSARLATRQCPQCFGMMFRGSRHCPRCGALAGERETASTETARNCPRCRTALTHITLGTTEVRECNACDGLWVDIASFEQICRDREQQSALLGTAQFTSTRQSVNEQSRVRYVPCPECGQLMNRVNFARCSGVVVDVCKGHGTWFDRDELAEIVEFIRGGGLDEARAREKAQLEETRRSLREEQAALARNSNPLILEDGERHSGITIAASSIIKILLND